MESLGYRDWLGHIWPRKTDEGDPVSGDRCGRCDVQSGFVAGRPCSAVLNEPLLPFERAAEQAAAAPDTGSAAQRWQEIRSWMEIQLIQDLDRIGEKAIRYGAADLRVMGRAMEALLPAAGTMTASDRERSGLEMAIGFYAMGKTARLYGAWEKGLEPEEDCWFDCMVYSLMARYVREFGSWM
jgi:hypothetical protein